MIPDGLNLCSGAMTAFTFTGGDGGVDGGCGGCAGGAGGCGGGGGFDGGGGGFDGGGGDGDGGGGGDDGGAAGGGGALTQQTHVSKLLQLPMFVPAELNLSEPPSK